MSPKEEPCKTVPGRMGANIYMRTRPCNGGIESGIKSKLNNHVLSNSHMSAVVGRQLKHSDFELQLLSHLNSKNSYRNL